MAAAAPAGAPAAPAAQATAPHDLLSPRRRILAGLVLALSNFMIVLDLTIANVSVPHIAGDLGITLEQGAWIITSYAIAEAICVPLTGWLAQRFGVVKMFVASMVGFGLFSLLCGMSVTLGMLVAFRIGQGICGAPIMPMSQTLMLRVFPPEKRGMAMGLWAMTTLLGPALGPIIGGVISDSWSWHWIFLINIPVAAVCTIAGWWLLRPVETEVARTPIDKVGLGLLVLWIGALQVMLDIGRNRDWFADPAIVALGIVAAVGFVVFVIWELTEEHPVVDLRIFRYPGFTFPVIALALAFGAFFSSNVVIPQWLQVSLGYTATLAGFNVAFTAFAALLTAALVAKLLGSVDARLLVSAGIVWLAAMAVVRAGWTSEADFWTMAMPMFLQGLGVSFFVIPLTTMTLTVVRQDEVASAAGLQNFLRTMSMAVSTSIVLTFWGDQSRAQQNAIAEGLNPDRTVETMTGFGFSFEQARQTVAALVDREAITLALNTTSLVSAAVLLVAAAVIWFAPRPTGLGEVGPTH